MFHFRAFFITLFIVLALYSIAEEASGKADIPGCQTVPWGFLGGQRRTICDSPLQRDGSWMRSRVIWTPAHQVPFTCYGGSYYTSCSGGYFVDTRINDDQEYPVNPEIVLPDEPGHLS